MCSAAALLPLSSGRSAGARVLQPVPFALTVWRRAQRAAGSGCPWPLADQGRNEFVQQATTRDIDIDIALSTLESNGPTQATEFFAPALCTKESLSRTSTGLCISNPPRYVCDKIFGKKEDNFHLPIRARYAS